MPYSSRIVCLANSRRDGGRCVAGRESLESGAFGKWVRPIGDRPDHEIWLSEQRYSDGHDARLLDIIEMRMTKHAPEGHQSENYILDSSYTWTKASRVSWDELSAAVERFPGALWLDGESTKHGQNDKVSETRAKTLSNSLILLELHNFVLRVANENSWNRTQRKVRAKFTCGGAQYILAVTDPIIEDKYLAARDGEYAVNKARVCVSLGGAFKGVCYKLVAAIITPESAKG
jgi:hypothetical protein